MVDKIEYTFGHLTLEEVRAETEQIWQELRGNEGDATLTDEQRAELAAHETSGIEIRAGGEGIDPVIVPLVVAFVAPATTHVLKSLWDEKILPRIRAKRDESAVGEERERSEE